MSKVHFLYWYSTDGDICNDINKKGNEASNVINETANKRKEPLYAEVKKDKKVNISELSCNFNFLAFSFDCVLFSQMQFI